MDTGDCLGTEFGWGDDTPGGGAGPTDEFDEKGPEDCIKEGYTLTSCPEGKGPNKVCMYDDRYFEYLWYIYNFFLIYFYIFFIYQMLPYGRGRNLMGLVLPGAQT